MRLGFLMRQQVVAAIHAKVLRLNSASVAHASTGEAQRRPRIEYQFINRLQLTGAAALSPVICRVPGGCVSSLPAGRVPAVCQTNRYECFKNPTAAGHVVNLASNDVRRLDDALPFWIYVWSAPLETVCVLIMVAKELGWAPAAAGVSCILAVIPLQV